MTRTHALKLVARIAFASALFLFSTASSCDAGDRARWGCPEDEVCDPATEDGLHFGGVRMAEQLFDVGDVKTLAVGGRQHVEVFEEDADGHHALALPFTPTFDSDAIAIEGKHANVLTLRGVEGGVGYLRILSGKGELFDRISIAAVSIGEIRIRPAIVVLLDDGAATALYAPGSTGLLELRAVGGGSLVDEDAQIVGTGIAQTTWESFAVGDLATGSHQLTVTAGDQAARTLTFDVAHADRVISLLGDSVPRDGRAFICFGARNEGRPIHVGWKFAAEGGSLERTGFDGCVNVSAGSGNAVTVHAFADGQTAQLTLPIVDTSHKPSDLATTFHARGLAPWTSADTAGERASR